MIKERLIFEIWKLNNKYSNHILKKLEKKGNFEISYLDDNGDFAIIGKDNHILLAGYNADREDFDIFTADEKLSDLLSRWYLECYDEYFLRIDKWVYKLFDVDIEYDEFTIFVYMDKYILEWDMCTKNFKDVEKYKYEE